MKTWNGCYTFSWLEKKKNQSNWLFCDTWKLLKLNFQLAINKVFLEHSHAYSFMNHFWLLSHHQENWVATTETIWPANWKYLLSGPLWKKFTNTCYIAREGKNYNHMKHYVQWKKPGMKEYTLYDSWIRSRTSSTNLGPRQKGDPWAGCQWQAENKGEEKKYAHLQKLLKNSGENQTKCWIFITIDNNRCWQGNGGTGTLIHCWWARKMVQSLWITVWHFLKLLNIELSYDLAIPS